MNERLRELLQQAGSEIPPAKLKIYKNDDGTVTSGGWEYPLENFDELFKSFEKFAELIVEECCLYLENEAERLYGISASEVDPIFQSNFELCAEKCYDNSKGLKQHFGVEE